MIVRKRGLGFPIWLILECEESNYAYYNYNLQSFHQQQYIKREPRVLVATKLPEMNTTSTSSMYIPANAVNKIWSHHGMYNTSTYIHSRCIEAKCTCD